MNIPVRFSLLGRTINVIDRADLIQDRDWVGAADYNKDLIELLPASPLFVSSQAKKEQTFCHEFAHHLLYHAGGAINWNMKDGQHVYKNEEFVDLLGSLIQQALSTMEYKIPEHVESTILGV